VKLYIIAKEYAAEGDSITTTASTHGAGYPADYDFTAAPIVQTNNFATGGAFLDTLIGRAPLLDQIVSRKKSGDKYVLSVMVGTNDVSFGYRIGTGTQAEWIAAYTAYLDARRASGWFVIICTNISRGNPTSSPYGGTVDSQIIPMNTMLRGWVGTHADALCDFAANANFAPGGTVYNNLTYYLPDQTHPTVAGEDLMATIITPIINAHM
jgi:lysophospholipase L1-like esterase